MQPAFVCRLHCAKAAECACGSQRALGVQWQQRAMPVCCAHARNGCHRRHNASPGFSCRWVLCGRPGDSNCAIALLSHTLPTTGCSPLLAGPLCGACTSQHLDVGSSKPWMHSRAGVVGSRGGCELGHPRCCDNSDNWCVGMIGFTGVSAAHIDGAVHVTWLQCVDGMHYGRRDANSQIVMDSSAAAVSAWSSVIASTPPAHKCTLWVAAV